MLLRSRISATWNLISRSRVRASLIARATAELLKSEPTRIWPRSAKPMVWVPNPARAVQNIGRTLTRVLLQHRADDRSLPGHAVAPVLKHLVIRLSQVVIKGFRRFGHFRLL